jgi:hypothetical protein
MPRPRFTIPVLVVLLLAGACTTASSTIFARKTSRAGVVRPRAHLLMNHGTHKQGEGLLG